MAFKVLDLFAGCGGFSCGFEQAGFDIIGAIEFDKNAAHTYKMNHHDTEVFLGNIRDLDINVVKEKIGQPDVIIGGPPCQGFSVAGKRDINDSRNTLPLEFIKYINFFKPKVFVMENVKGILTLDNGNIIKFFLQEFEKAGYNLKLKVMFAVKHNVPQLRERVIIVGVRNDLQLEFEYPIEKNNIITLEDAIGDIERTGSFEEVGIYNHEYFSKVNENLYSLLKEGDFLCDLRHGETQVHSWEISLKGICTSKEKLILDSISENRRKKCYGPKDGNPLSIETIKELTHYEDISNELNHLVEMKYLERFGDKYDIHDRKINMGLRRFDRKLPVNTITTQSGTNSAYAHYSQPRNFTVREVARIQTFPDNFIFYGPISSQYRQVGNAVPVQLGKELAEQILKLFFK